MEDLEGIFRIYDYEVLNSTATYDTVPKTIEERVAWFHMSNHKYPILVAEGTLENDDSICSSQKTEIIGWARLYEWSPRLAYSRTAECAVYVDFRARGLGIGRQLLQELIRQAPEIGVRVIVGKMSNDNEVSVKLHSSLGFKTIGIMEKVGEKFGRLLDVRLMDLHIPE